MIFGRIYKVLEKKNFKIFFLLNVVNIRSLYKNKKFDQFHLKYLKIDN
jgi:hypothetical protein